jgi:serine/threonine protein kinase/Tol biopolymer transport system component
MIGTLLGHYRIVEVLGTGGMGTVYLAEDTRLQRRVALKILARELADPDRRERFEREARAAAALNHPNIVTIHSVEEAGGTPFLTLELIEGETLADAIPAGGLPLDRVLDVAIPLADAVGAAHQRGITHRDLKPANIMLSRDGRLKVLDFGLAKLKEDAWLVADAGMPTAALTGEGRIVGTVAYMSPEQAEGKPVDQRSDVFSLGVILYEIATGVRPFKGDTHMSILSAIIKDTPVSITEVRRELPRELAKIVKRCLAKDVEDRYQTAKDLRNDLRALKNDLTSGEMAPITSGSDAAAVPRRRSRRNALMAAAAVTLVAIAGSAYFIWTRASGTPARVPSETFDSVRLTRLTTSGTAGFAAISGDGRYVVHVSRKGGEQSLWLRQVATTSNVEIVPPADVRYVGVSFSPDGNHIYYTRYPGAAEIAQLFEVPVLGGGARLILDDIDTSVTFSPDGREIAFVRGLPSAGAASVMVANVDGTNVRTLATRKPPVQFPLRAIAWSPNGRYIAAPGANGLRAEVVIIEVATGAEQVLPTPGDWRQVNSVAWLPDGFSLLVNAQESAAESSNQIFRVDYPSGAPRRITNDLSTYSGLSVSPGGESFVCIRNERRATIWTMPIGDPKGAKPVGDEGGTDLGVHGIAWTADARLVYTTEASGNPDIWIMNVDGSNRVQLTSTPGQDVSPRVAPDGKYIIFVSDRDGALRLWRMGLDGSGAMRLGPDQVARSRAALSADGKWIYYNDSTGGFKKVSIDGGTPIAVFDPELLKRLAEPLPSDFHEPLPSPDGSVIAGHYLDDASRGERVVLIPMQGGPLKRLTTVPASATWSPDGRSLFFVESEGGASQLKRYPLPAGPAVQLTNFTSDQIFSYALSPHQRVALVRGQVLSDVVLISSESR